MDRIAKLGHWSFFGHELDLWTLGLIFGLIFGLNFGMRDIQPVESIQVSTSHETQRKVLQSLLGWMIMGLIAWLIPWVAGRDIGAIIGLLVFGLIRALVDGMKQDLTIRLHPNQGVWKSLRNVLFIPTSISLFCFLYFPPQQFSAVKCP